MATQAGRLCLWTNCWHAKGFVRCSGDLESFLPRPWVQLLIGIQMFELCCFSSVPEEQEEGLWWWWQKEAGISTQISFNFISLVILHIFVCSGSVNGGTHHYYVESKGKSEVRSVLLLLVKLWLSDLSTGEKCPKPQFLPDFTAFNQWHQ